MNGAVRLLGTLLIASAGCASHACSCLGPELFLAKDGDAVAIFDGADFVVHGRVEALLPGNAARLRIIEAFKGQAGDRRVAGLMEPSESCGMTFAVGEEQVYLARRGVVTMCDRLEPSSALLEALRDIAARRAGTKQR